MDINKFTGLNFYMWQNASAVSRQDFINGWGQSIVSETEGDSVAHVLTSLLSQPTNVYACWSSTKWQVIMARNFGGLRDLSGGPQFALCLSPFGGDNRFFIDIKFGDIFLGCEAKNSLLYPDVPPIRDSALRSIGRRFWRGINEVRISDYISGFPNYNVMTCNIWEVLRFFDVDDDLVASYEGVPGLLYTTNFMPG